MPGQTIIYYVGTDPALSRALGEVLGKYDIETQVYDEPANFLAALRSRQTEDCCLLMDFGESTWFLLGELSAADYHCPVIVLAEEAQTSLRQQLIEAGATDLIDKPLVATYLYTRLGEVVPGARRLPSTPPSTMELPDGTQATFRMMHPEDAEIEQQFVTGLSDESRYLRFFSGIKELPPYMLEQLTNPDFPISYALIATIPDGDKEVEIGVARYAPTNSEGVAEFAVTVADDWQGCGIASQLMRGVIAAAAVGGINRLEGIVLKENVAMLALAEHLGFRKTPTSDAGPSVTRVVKDLREPPEQDRHQLTGE